MYEKLKQDDRQAKESLYALERQKQPKEQALTMLQTNLAQLKATLEGMQREVGSDLQSQLTDDEQGEIERLNDEIARLNADLKEVSDERIRVWDCFCLRGRALKGCFVAGEREE